MSEASPAVRQVRVDLAAACRMAARLDWQEAVANHFSMAVSADGRQFLMNPLWRHFSRMRASDLLLLDVEAGATANAAAVDRTAWAIHGTMHSQLPRARCILHVHPPHATAWSCLADPAIRPIDQTSARFYKRVAIDAEYGGMADNVAEGMRLTHALADKSVLIMGNHGVLVVGKSIPQAFERLYFLERAAQAQVLALSTGRPLKLIPQAVVRKTVAQFGSGGMVGGHDRADLHFDALKRVLDRSQSDYAS
jgi:ribulose-5-phosphate 4-epimerase/fuculose-1-phosphate aldolase